MFNLILFQEMKDLTEKGKGKGKRKGGDGDDDDMEEANGYRKRIKTGGGGKKGGKHKGGRGGKRH